MQFRALAAAAALAVTVVASPVNAQDNKAPKDTTKGFYATLSAGGSWASSPALTGSDSATRTNLKGTLGLGGGVAGEAGLGYDFGNNLRAQLTYVRNTYSLGKLSVSGTTFGIPVTGTATQSGTLSTNSVFAGAYYDIPTKSKLTPYVGAGIGWTSVNYPSGTQTATVTALGTTVSASAQNTGGSACVFGYTARIGVSCAVAKPADIFVEGIYQGSTSATIGTSTIVSLDSFGALAGIRYRFGS